MPRASELNIGLLRGEQLEPQIYVQELELPGVSRELMISASWEYCWEAYSDKGK
jgi:hypothetical protein